MDRPMTEPKARIMGLDDKFRFGLYQGQELWSVLEYDPRYIDWCIENVGGFLLDNEAWDAYQQTQKP